jgi:hypothetical protein
LQFNEEGRRFLKLGLTKGAIVSRVVVTLSSERDRCGQIELAGNAGEHLCGPFVVAGRSSNLLAATHQNPQRLGILPYGDTPTGNFVIRTRLQTGQGTPLAKYDYGPWGALVLEGITGDAAIADANGRFTFLLHGGDLSSDGLLRSTAGALRMRNADLRALLRAVEKANCKSCEIIEVDELIGEPIFDDQACALPDPLRSAMIKVSTIGNGGKHLPRRGTVLIAMGATFIAQGTVHAMPAQGATASPSRVPGHRDVHWLPAAVVATNGMGQAYNPPPEDGTGISTREPAAADAVTALVKAQDKAISNPDFGPGVGGSTHCNQATCEVAKELGAPMTPFTNSDGTSAKSTQINENLAKPGSGYKPVSEAQAVKLAREGKLVIVAAPGHVATVRPDNIPGQTRPPGSGPVIANVGRTNGILSLNYVFKPNERKKVQYYTPDTDK